MDFGADASNTALLRILQKRSNESAADAFTTPLRRNEERDDVHGLAAEFGPPLVRCIRVAAQRPFVVLGDDHQTSIRVLHDVRENAARIFFGALRADIRQKLAGQLTQLIHVVGDRWTDLKRFGAHGYDARMRGHIVISNWGFRKTRFQRYSFATSMSRMSKFNRAPLLIIGLTLLLMLCVTTLPWPQRQPQPAANFDVSIEQFAGYVDKWSEAEGYFDTDNFLSNETSYLHVIDELQKQVKPGGVYLGVGPDQNFSYIVHTRPTLAVITDIRRQNMLELLWYKALFAMAANRVEFV